MKTSERLWGRALALQAKSIKLLFDSRDYYRAHGIETWEEFKEDYECLKQRIKRTYEHVRESEIGQRTIEKLQKQGLDR